MPKEKKQEITLHYQNYIPKAPHDNKVLIKTAGSNDDATYDVWADIWVKNATDNFNKFGGFAHKGLGLLHNRLKNQPCIVAGSGPSLARNGHELSDRKGIGLISCLHNFHFFEDNGVDVDFYVTLDAGEVVIEEVSEGGSLSEDEYWERTKDKVLLAFIGSPPKLLEKWRGEIYFYNALMRGDLKQKIDELEVFNTNVSPGGNALGACHYIARAIMGANPVAFVGADFSFGYDRRFHAWDSKYDKDMGNVVHTVDVFGNKVYTWQSYHGFKCYFDYISTAWPGIYINCTEGGTMGAYPEGNIMSIQQMDLCDFLKMYSWSEMIEDTCKSPSESEPKIII